MFDTIELRARARAAFAAAGAATIGVVLGAVAFSASANVPLSQTVPPSQVAVVALPPTPAAQPAAVPAAPAVKAVKPAATAEQVKVDETTKPVRTAASARDVECLTEAVYFEARGESKAGQAAVAQVVLNRVKHPAFPKTVCGVVYQGAKRHGCQFSFACDGRAERVSESAAWGRAHQVATRALAGVVVAEIGASTHFHTVQVHPAWAPHLLRTAQVGMHVFYKFKSRGGGGSIQRAAAPATVQYARLVSSEGDAPSVALTGHMPIAAHADEAGVPASQTSPASAADPIF